MVRMGKSNRHTWVNSYSENYLQTPLDSSESVLETDRKCHVVSVLDAKPFCLPMTVNMTTFYQFGLKFRAVCHYL